MIYLDNAATSFPKPEKVYDEINRCMREYCANPGRGGHVMSIESGKAVMQAREVISDFFNIANPLQLCFTKNATEALNIAIKGYLNKGDHVITTSMEHNSVIRPLKTLERDTGIEITIVKGDEFGEIDAAEIKNHIKSQTRLIVSTLSSNVNGIVMPVKEIGEIAKDNNIPFLLDASQGAGSINIDVKAFNISMLAFPGHKGLFGPQGTGGLYVDEKIKLKSSFQGGTGSNSEMIYQPEFMPDLLESGTLNTPGIVGLGCGIGFIKSFGIDNLAMYKQMLVGKLFDGISGINGIKIYSKNNIENNSGIIAFNFKDVESTEVSYVLDKVYGIASRAGLHCSPIAHETLGTIKSGIVRLSVSCFNTLEEIETTIKAIQEIGNNLEH